MTSGHDNFSRFLDFREEYPWLSFDSYQYHFTGKSLEIRFIFNLSDRIHFSPKISFPYKEKIFPVPGNWTAEALDNLVFHMGMIELISYWKAACPAEVIIKPHGLEPGQINFWKKIYFHGLGEFFHKNSIRTGLEDFMSISSEESNPVKPFYPGPLQGGIVPVGGGKDSAVTLGLLNKFDIDWIPFVINPRTATQEVIRAAAKSDPDTIVAHREIDPELLRLNSEGFLNGHTPFSALLAFYSLLAAYLSGRSEIILSNESSANEPTIPGTTINHQYSKSIGFERDFRQYYHKYISPEFDYFSLLRPLSELQIAGIFSGMPRFFNSFKSCNAGSKSDAWCGNCPKCLFTFIILSPFIEPSRLEGIFGKNLLDEPLLKETLAELTGMTASKPFDCIGTTEEVRMALAGAVKYYQDRPLPYLLSLPSSRNILDQYDKREIPQIMANLGHEHFIPEKYLHLLDSMIS